MKLIIILFFFCAVSFLKSEEISSGYQNPSTLDITKFSCTKRVSLINSKHQKIVCVYRGTTSSNDSVDSYFHTLNLRNAICSRAEEIDTTLIILHQDNLLQANYKVPSTLVNEYGHTLIQCALAVEKHAEFRYFYYKDRSDNCLDTAINLSSCVKSLDTLLDSLEAEELEHTEADKIRRKGQRILEIDP